MVDQIDGNRGAINRGPTALKQQSAVARLGLFALESHSLSEVMRETVRVVVDALGADLCSVLTLRKVDGSFLVRAGHGWKEGLVGSARVGSDEDESLAGYTLATGKPVMVDVLDEETRFFVAPR
ncbi:MAG: GAF domain-containing protein, partial [Rhodothermales bacterium]